MFRRIAFKLSGRVLNFLVWSSVLFWYERNMFRFSFRYNRGRKVWDYAPLSGMFDFHKAHMVRIFDG